LRIGHQLAIDLIKKLIVGDGLIGRERGAGRG
jgi:hypothetical protein